MNQLRSSQTSQTTFQSFFQDLFPGTAASKTTFQADVLFQPFDIKFGLEEECRCFQRCSEKCSIRVNGVLSLGSSVTTLWSQSFQLESRRYSLELVDGGGRNSQAEWTSAQGPITHRPPHDPSGFCKIWNHETNENCIYFILIKDSVNALDLFRSISLKVVYHQL